MGTLTRVARTAAAVLEHTFYVGETPTAAAGPVTVTVTDPAATVVATGTATPTGTDGYTFPLPGQSALTELQVSWAGTVAGAAVVEVDQVQIVGGFLFDLVQARASDKSLQDTVKYPTGDLVRVRTEVEQECEWICAQAWVPRYRRVVLDGTGTPDLTLPDGADEHRGGVHLRGVRTIRSATIAPRFGLPAVALTVEQLAALTVRPGGVLRRADGSAWTAGDSNIVVAYEYGSDAAPADLVRAALTRLRDRLNFDKKQVPDRAVSFTVAEMGTYRLSLPDAYRTGLPEVDAAYARYSRRVAGDDRSARPASVTLDYNPQYHSLYHGGRR